MAAREVAAREVAVTEDFGMAVVVRGAAAK